MKSITKIITSSALCTALALGSFTAFPSLAQETTNIKTEEVEVIAPSSVTLRQNFTCGTDYIRINWNKVEDVDGYAIYRYDESKNAWKILAKLYDGDFTSFRDEYKILPGKNYKYKVASFINLDGVSYESELSDELVTATRPEKTVMKASDIARYNIRLNWEKEDCSGFKVFRYQNNKWSQIANVKAGTTSYTVKNLTPGTDYRFKVVAYTTFNNKIVHGEESNVTNVTTLTDSSYSSKVTMPANVTGKTNTFINIKPTKNKDNYRVYSAKVTSDSVKYSYRINRDSVSVKFTKAGKYRVSVTFKNSKGKTVTCFTNVTVK